MHTFAHAFWIETDATGVLVQPIPGGDKQRRASTRDHYFVQIPDADNGSSSTRHSRGMAAS